MEVIKRDNGEFVVRNRANGREYDVDFPVKFEKCGYWHLDAPDVLEQKLQSGDFAHVPSDFGVDLLFEIDEKYQFRLECMESHYPAKQKLLDIMATQQKKISELYQMIADLRGDVEQMEMNLEGRL